MRTIFYDETDLYSVRDCVAKVKEAAKTALADPTALKTPLTNLDAFSAIREQAVPGSADELIASALQEIQTKLDRLEYRMEQSGRDSMETRNPLSQPYVFTGGPNPTIQASSVRSDAPWIADQEARQREVPPAE
jgi:hypothetical protein